MRLRRPVTVSTLAVALLATTAWPAAAHPGFRDGATAPARSLASLELAMAHGCGTEADAGGDPTTEVSIEVPEAFSHIAPGEVDGYEVTTEGAGSVPETVTWTATDGGIPAPVLPMEVVVDGDPGDEVYVKVFQGCDGFSYRWVGTPDEPADDPAVRLTLGEIDPDSPPPPAPEAPDIEEEPGLTGEGEIAPVDDDAATDTPDETDEVAPEDDETPAAVEELPTEPPAEEDGDGGLGWLPIAIGAVVLAGLGGLLASRRKQPVLDPTAREPGDPEPTTGDAPTDDR